MAGLTPGENRYKAVTLLKKGRYGVVTRVIEKGTMQQRIVRNFQQPPGVTEVALLQAIDREARLLKTLSHPSLPHLHQVVEGDGGTWLVFDYIEGAPLSYYLEHEKTISEDWIMWWLDRLLAALEALHEHQPPVVIGYLEPADVVVQGHSLWLADVGLLEDMFPETAAGLLANHPYLNFVAPERRMSAQTVPGHDLFSASAIAFWLATGQAPVVTSPKSAQHNLLALQDYRPDLPEEVAHLISEGLSFYPSQRPTSARDMRARLAPYLRDMTGKPMPKVPLVEQPQSFAEETRRFEVMEEEVRPAPKPIIREDAPEPELPPTVTESQEFVEDIWFQVRSRPMVLTSLAVILVILVVVGLQHALRPPPEVSAPLMTVASGHLMQKVAGHPAPGEPQWLPTATVSLGATVAVERDSARLTFDSGSSLTLTEGSQVQCVGRDHEKVSVRLLHGEIDVQLKGKDGLVVHLPPGNVVTLEAAAQAILDVTADEKPPVLVLKLKDGKGTVTVGSDLVPLTATTRLSLDGRKVVKEKSP